MSEKINGVAKALAVLAAGAMTVGLAAAPSAFAVDTALGNIDTNKTGSITLEKHKQTSENGKTQGDGTEQTNVAGETMQGVTFYLYQVQGFDVNTPSNWNNLTDLKLDGNKVMEGTTQVGTVNTTTPTQTGVTDTKGQIKWDSLPLGLYYIVEGGYASTSEQILQKSDPFFVSVPYPNANKAWNYDVYVYPKNTVGTTSKQVDADTTKNALKVGDDVTWDITQAVPSLGENEKVTNFGIVDQLDSNVTYKSVTVTAVDANGTAISGVTLTAGTDYTVDSTVTRAGDTHKYVSITFTAAGLAKLNNLAAGSKVLFKLTATVNSNFEGTNVPNAVFPITNDYNPFNETGSNPPVTSKDEPFYGDYSFKKVDDQTPAKPLQGAEFKLWRGTDQASCAAAAVPSDAMTATSGADGMVNFTGILIGVANKGTDPAQVTGTFCVRETQAPAGFVTPDTSKTQFVTLHAGRGTAGNTGKDVVNTKQTGPNLPMTGAAGTILLTSIAAVALAVALSLYMVNARRRQQKR